MKRFCSGVNGQASQLSPRVFLQPDTDVVQYSFAGVWKFSSQDSLQPDAAVFDTLVLLSGSSLLRSLCGMTQLLFSTLALIS